MTTKKRSYLFSQIILFPKILSNANTKLPSQINILKLNLTLAAYCSSWLQVLIALPREANDMHGTPVVTK